MKSELAKFYGSGKEDAEHFVEGFELDCILQGIHDEKIMLQLFRLCLQDGARLWFNDFGAQSRDVCYDAVKEAFLAHYKHVEDATDVWHQLEACLQKEVSFGLCALDVDNRLTSRTMDVFGVALGHVLLDFMARSMVALVLYDGLCYICGLQQVYDACMVNKKQGTDCIGDDHNWGFNDPAVEMNEEMQPFVDAALGRIWVMQEQQSHEVVMNRSEVIHMYGREGGSDVCVGFDYGLASIKI
ncbi:hypothetical protein L7F22_009418 [Adiantum nelumboides]|nr:hypothetical protein [Adiantum nelumboides]